MTVSSEIYDKRDNCNFEIVNFPFLDGDVQVRGVVRTNSCGTPYVTDTSSEQTPQGQQFVSYQ